jgi:hypothetical protein
MNSKHSALPMATFPSNYVPHIFNYTKNTLGCNNIKLFFLFILIGLYPYFTFFQLYKISLLLLTYNANTVNK